MLRRPRPAQPDGRRHRTVHHAHGFVEVETPTLIKSTPEGARDFIVPSPAATGRGVRAAAEPAAAHAAADGRRASIRYFQIARVLPRRGPSGRPQPEFTQLDLEMSFVDEANRDGLRRGDGDSGVPPDRARAADRFGAFPVVTLPRPSNVRLPISRTPLRDGARRGGPRAGGWWTRRAALPRVFGVFDSACGRAGQGDRRAAGMGGVTLSRDRRADRPCADGFARKGLDHLSIEAGREVPAARSRIPGRRHKRRSSSDAARTGRPDPASSPIPGPVRPTSSAAFGEHG
jgi:hypothetical protein